MSEIYSFGEWVRRRRRALDLTQALLAEQVGCAASMIRKIEADERRPSRQVAELLADALQVPERERDQFLRTARAELAPDQLLPPSDVVTSPPAISAVPKDNLPLALTSFIGRETEIAAIQDLVAGHRLVTLTGSGGTGKTRLALEVAARLRAQFTHGVWLVELASVSDPALVVSSVAGLFGLREDDDGHTHAILATYLRYRHVLLVFDNCEHLIDACAQLSEALLRACPQLRLLATSREALKVAGEAIYRVPPLRLPDLYQPLHRGSVQETEAVHLFVDRARLAFPGFQLTDTNVDAVAQICARLDGIPLAIELAAARTPFLRVEQIATRLNDRFRLLTYSTRTALPRHQTLRALIDWSYELLTVQEQQLLQRVAVFRGGWNLEAAENVCTGEIAPATDVLDLLVRLVDKSLVQIQRVLGMESRYDMLETLREYALEQLAKHEDAELVYERHAEWVLKHVRQLEAQRGVSERRQWLALLTIEDNNIRASLAWCQRSGHVMLGLSLASALWQFWVDQHRFNEGNEWLTWFLTHEDIYASQTPTAQARSRALIGAATISNHQGHFVRAGELLSSALVLAQACEDTHAMAWAFNELGEVAFRRENYEEARKLREQSLALFRAHEDKGGVALVLGNLGRVARETGDYEEASTLFQASLATARESGDILGMATALKGLGTVRRRQGDIAAARSLYEQSLTLCRTINDRWGMALCLDALATTIRRQGDDTTAQTYFHECLSMYQEFGDQRNIAFVLRKLGLIAFHQNDLTQAQDHLVESLCLFRILGKPKNVAYALLYAGLATFMLSDLRSAAMYLTEATALFRSMEQHDGLVESLAGLALVAFEDGRLEDASKMLSEAISHSQEYHQSLNLSYHDVLQNKLTVMCSQLSFCDTF